MRFERAEASEGLELCSFPPRQLRNSDENLNLNEIAEKEFLFPLFPNNRPAEAIHAAKVKVDVVEQ